MTADASTPTAEARTQSFEADVSRLLHLMVHSVYSDRAIFVRELVSNAADACEKLRYEAIAKPELIEDGAPFAIEIAINPDAKTLTFSDNGVGMTREDLTQGLGTIARSGTKAFLDKLAADDASKEAAALIGQFGIGFYSSFMVADEVVVDTRRAGASEAWRWSSDGKGSFTIAPLALESAPKRGTRVTLHLNDEAHEFAEPRKVERIVREHSGAVAVPIDLIEKLGAEKRRIGDGAAIWAKPKSDVTAEEYTEFYRGLSGQFDEPALTLHWRAEGRHEYTVLAFIPGSRPFDLFDPARKGRNKLYVRRVLITEDADLLPGWLQVRPPRGRQRRPAAQRLPRDDPEERRLRGDPQGRHQPRSAGARQARRGRAGQVRQGVGAFRPGHQGGSVRGPRAPRRPVQDRPLHIHHPSGGRPDAGAICRRAYARTRPRSFI